MEFSKNKEEIDLEYLNMMIDNLSHSIDQGLDHVYMGYNVVNDYEFKSKLAEQYQVAKEENQLEKLKDVAWGTMCGQDFSGDKFALQVITNYPELFEYWLKNDICDKFEVYEYHQDYKLPKSEWNKLIDLLLEGSIKLEEYEICAKLNEIRKKLWK